jgi:hypothetical protein
VADPAESVGAVKLSGTSGADRSYKASVCRESDCVL